MPLTLPQHGGHLSQAIAAYGGSPADWLDLSTGVSPYAYPVPMLAEGLWQRLPEPHDEALWQAAADYYGSPAVLAGAGSSQFIQCLPRLRPPGKVAILAPAYAEHAFHWQLAGHAVQLTTLTALEAGLADWSVVVVVRPGNPDGRLLPLAQLARWRQQLARQGGWLIVDEAFIDPLQPTLPSLITPTPQPGLMVLRSFGKFFGLAGARLGFIWAEATLLQQLRPHLGPWPISAASAYLGQCALADRPWQQQARQRIQQAGDRLAGLCSRYGLAVSSAGLFVYHQGPRALALAEHLANRHILVRRFDPLAAIRIGLPAHSTDWQRLEQELIHWQTHG